MGRPFSLLDSCHRYAGTLPMTTPMPRRFVWVIMAGAVALMMLALWAAGSVGEGWLIKRAESALAKALVSNGLALTLGSETQVNLFATPQVIFQAVELNPQSNTRSEPVALFKRMEVNVALAPLFLGEVQIQSLSIQQPSLTLVQKPDGNFVPSPQDKLVVKTFGPANVEVRDASVRIVNQAGEQLVSARHCDFHAPSLKVAGEAERMPSRLAFKGDLTCTELHKGTLIFADMKAVISAHDGIFDIAFQFEGLRSDKQKEHTDTSSDTANKATSQGRLTADYSQAQPSYDLHYAMTGYEVGPYLKGRWANVAVQGQIDLALELHLSGVQSEQLKRSANGHLSIQGESLTLDGIDLDRWLTDVETSQHFDVVDIGAVIFGGPFGLILTQAYDFATLAQKSPGHSQVQKLVSDWVIKDGVAQAVDVAFATSEHRLVLLGNIDLVKERYDAMTVALITPEGCPILKQEIHGPISKPQIDTANVFTRLTAPVVGLLKDVKETLTQEDCEVIYKGAVIGH